MNIITASKEEFMMYQSEYRTRIQQIVIPEDINTQLGKVLLSQLDVLYAELRIDFGKLEAAKDRAESIVRQHERSKAEGRNEDDRKKNATLFLESFPISEEETVNMYEWQRDILQRYTILKSYIDVINNKQNRLITISGLMKIDKDLGSGMHAHL